MRKMVSRSSFWVFPSSLESWSALRQSKDLWMYRTQSGIERTIKSERNLRICKHVCVCFFVSMLTFRLPSCCQENICKNMLYLYPDLKFMTVAWQRPKNSMSLVSELLKIVDTSGRYDKKRQKSEKRVMKQPRLLGHSWCVHASCDPIHAHNRELLAKSQTASVRTQPYYKTTKVSTIALV